MLDAPVSGGEPVRSKDPAIMVGGKEKVFQ